MKIFENHKILGGKPMVIAIIDMEFIVPPTFGKPRAFFPEVIEFGAVLIDSDSHAIITQINTFVKPMKWPRITKETTDVTGIHQSDIDKCSTTLETVLSDLCKIASSDIVLMAWGSEDKKVLLENCKRYEIKFPFNPDSYIDLLDEYMKMNKFEKKVSLKNAIEQCGFVPSGISHAALDDAMNTLSILNTMFDKGWQLPFRFPASP
jgi:sporulation inhibitor KapD